MIDAELLNEWATMLKETVVVQDAVASEMLEVANVQSGLEYLSRPPKVNDTPVKKEAQTTFHETSGDREALLKSLKRTIKGDPVHGGAQSPVKLIRLGGREVLLYTMEDVYAEFGI